MNVIAYGNTRDLVTGVEAVLADGRIVNALSKLRKDNTGYDVKSLFIGAEGTLGIVTAASLRLFPNPRAQATAFVGLKSPEDALKLLRMARERLGAAITSFELISRNAYDIGIRHGGARAPLQGAHDWYVLVEASSQTPSGLDEAFAGALEAALETGRHRGRFDRRFARAARGLLAIARVPVRRAEQGRRLDQARRVRGGWPRADVDQGGDARGRSLRAGRPRGRLRPPRRRQYPLQRVAAGRRRQAGLSRSLGRDERDRARNRRAPRRLLFRRARRGSAQARTACEMEGSRVARNDAPDQGGARPERGDESGQGALSPSPSRVTPCP